MSGTTRSSENLDTPRRRLLFRAWHRGMREMDLILGRFCDAEIDRLSDDEVRHFETLIDEIDQDLHQWIAGDTPPPAHVDGALIRRIRAFHHRQDPSQS